jgi:hypothetical protein
LFADEGYLAFQRSYGDGSLEKIETGIDKKTARYLKLSEGQKPAVNFECSE